MRAAIFDMDGLLIDSEPVWQTAEIEVFATVGLELTRAQCEETTGLRIDTVVAVRHAQAPWDDPPQEAIVDRDTVREEMHCKRCKKTRVHVSRCTGGCKLKAYICSFDGRDFSGDFRYLGVEVDDALAIAEKADV